ncbi:MAG: hypothetical protein OEZ35_08260 [Candidatus Bathyarchaeota archaeon]|nr:hypothetical protein [Candidatus Bathyarchaeota archaeon]
MVRLLLAGIDTLECAYYLANSANCDFFAFIGSIKEYLRQSKSRDSQHAKYGNMEFLVEPYGSGSGYPFILNNKDFRIQCGEFNNPSFHVKFSSESLWRDSPQVLHDRFIAWASSAGFEPFKQEGLSRVDFSFDYSVSTMNFDEDSMVTMSDKDSIHRENNQIQTLTFGKGDVVLRIYNKVAEINQSSHKEWFFDLWGQKEHVWRIEWQVRKETLKRFGIRTIEELGQKKKGLLKWLSGNHDTLRIPSLDNNRSRWPLHPLWVDLQMQIENMEEGDAGNQIEDCASIRSLEKRNVISVYGYLKRLAAIRSIMLKEKNTSLPEALKRLERQVRRIHDPMTWEMDVEKRIKEMEHGRW